MTILDITSHLYMYSSLYIMQAYASIPSISLSGVSFLGLIFTLTRAPESSCTWLLNSSTSCATSSGGAYRSLEGGGVRGGVRGVVKHMHYYMYINKSVLRAGGGVEDEANLHSYMIYTRNLPMQWVQYSRWNFTGNQIPRDAIDLTCCVSL